FQKLLRLIPRQKSHIEVGRRFRGNYVGLFRALQHGERNGVAEKVVERLIRLNRVLEILVLQSLADISEFLSAVRWLVRRHGQQEFLNDRQNLQWRSICEDAA